LIVAQDRDGEFDRDPLFVLRQGRDGQQIAFAVTAVAGGHDVAIALPVPGSEFLGNDQIERLTQGLRGIEAEDAGGAGVPEHDLPLDI